MIESLPESPVIFSNPRGNAFLMRGDKLLVFSSPEAAEEYIAKTGLTGVELKQFDSWEGLANKFGQKFDRCLIDHPGEPVFHATTPLR